MRISGVPMFMSPLAADVDKILGATDDELQNAQAAVMILACVMAWYDDGSKGGRAAFRRAVHRGIEAAYESREPKT